MENISNTRIIDNLIIGRVDPQIYAFSTQTIPNYLKVGDTYRPVEIRLDEWRKVFPNLEKEFSGLAKVDDSVYFRDYEVHHFLVNDVGRERLTPDIFPDRPYSQEFFKEATVQDIKDAIDDIHYSYEKGNSKYHFYRDGTPVVFHYNHEEDYQPRPNQAATIDRFEAAYGNGRRNLLMYAVMRFGKSFTSMCCAVEMDARLVVVVSGKADVKDEWKKTVEGHKKFVDYEYLIGEDLLRDNNILSNTLKEKRAVLFLTLQDLSGDKIKKKHKEIFQNKIDLLIIDETHFGTRAKEYGKVLTENKVFISERQAAREFFDSDNSLDEVDKMTKTLNAKMRIHLSGTPYRILMGSEFSKEDIIAFYQFSDIVKDQEEYDKEHLLDADYKEWDNPYYGFPQMIRFAFNPNKSSIEKMESMRKKGVTYAFSALFRPCSIDKDISLDKRHCFFENEKEIMDLLMVIDGTKEDTNVLGFLDYDKIREGKLCRHIVCVLPYCASCDALENLINKNADTFKNLREYTIINISGWENTAYKTIESVKNKIKQLESNNKKSLTLTVNKMLTGCTVPEWDTMIFLKDTASPQEYDQAIFRLQNQYIKTYTDDKGNIIKYNMKPQTLLVDFDPNRMFTIQEQKSKIYNVNTVHNGNEKLRERIEEDLRISPIITINKGLIHEITPANIMDSIRNYSSKKSVLDEATDIAADYSLLYDVNLRKSIEALSPIDAQKGIEIKATDDENDDDYEIPDDFDNNPNAGDNNPSSSNLHQASVTEDAVNWDKKIATLYSLILFYSFLTDSYVSSLKDVICSIKDDDINKRIAKNVGLKFNILVLMRQRLNPFILSDLDYKIQNINTLLRDNSLEPIERANVAVNKFSRLSSSEIVTPQNKADEFVRELNIKPNAKMLDVASKQAEFAYSIYKVLGESCKDDIYSIPTSALAYEFTIKVYKLLGLNTENVFCDFTTYDLINSDYKEKIIERLNNMNFGYVIGNPPYQDQGGAGGNNDAPIYQRFCNIADRVTSGVSSLVIKAGWFSAGRENLLGDFRRDMLTSRQVKRLVTYANSRDIFANVEIKGGICYYIKDKSYSGDCNYTLMRDGKAIDCMRDLSDFDILIREPILNDIVKKVHEKAVEDEVEFVDTIISSDTPFGIPSNPRSSKKNPFTVYETKADDHDVLLFHIEKLHRKIEYCSRKQVRKNVQDIKYDKVFVPCSGGSGDDKMVIGVPELAPANSVCSQSYLYAKFPSAKEASNFLSYMKTKFFRILVSAVKITQACPKKAYRFVPMQDYNKPWTDEELYAMYGLTNEEIDYIENKLEDMLPVVLLSSQNKK